MKRLAITGLTIFTTVLLASAAMADSGKKFSALAKVRGVSLLTNQELSEVEGSALIFGSVNTPLYYDSISAFLSEVLLTLLGVDGRSPIATHTTVRTVFSPLPGGGISVGIQPDTFILVKNLTCVGCTRP